MGDRICIVSSGCLSSGPRVVKEADALAEAGYEVQVVVCHTLPWMPAWDAELAAGKAWGYRAVDWSATRRRRSVAGLASRALRYAATACVRQLGSRPVIAELASDDRVLPLLAAVLAEPARLYIAHNLAALPVAAAAARAHRAALGFDAEDDHLGELPQTEWVSAAGRTIDAVMRRYLPRCGHLTAASEGIASALAERYGVRRPVVVHNVFPWADRESMDGEQRERGAAPLSIYWYSQSLGLDRGLQDVLRACGLLRGDFELHLRGSASSDVRSALLALAGEVGVAHRVYLHPQVPPAELLSRTSEHDVGLALEQPVSQNRLRTVTNKLFFYMLAGLAVAATDTPGQRGVMETLPQAGFTYRPGDHAALARGLQRYLDEPEALARAREAALEAARSRYCWERERLVLTDATARCLSAG